MAGKNSNSSSISHFIGGVFKYVMIIGVIGASITLSFMFFFSIAPADKPWLPYALECLTELGLVGWILVFRLQRHDTNSKGIAIIMICVCAAAVVTTDFLELQKLLGGLGIVGLVFVGLFAAHIIAFLFDQFAAYFARNPFGDESYYQKVKREQANATAGPGIMDRLVNKVLPYQEGYKGEQKKDGRGRPRKEVKQ